MIKINVNGTENTTEWSWDFAKNLQDFNNDILTSQLLLTLRRNAEAPENLRKYQMS